MHAEHSAALLLACPAIQLLCPRHSCFVLPPPPLPTPQPFPELVFNDLYIKLAVTSLTDWARCRSHKLFLPNPCLYAADEAALLLEVLRGGRLLCSPFELKEHYSVV